MAEESSAIRPPGTDGFHRVDEHAQRRIAVPKVSLHVRQMHAAARGVSGELTRPALPR